MKVASPPSSCPLEYFSVMFSKDHFAKKFLQKAPKHGNVLKSEDDANSLESHSGTSNVKITGIIPGDSNDEIYWSSA